MESLVIAIELILKHYLEHITRLGLKTTSWVKDRIKAAQDFLNYMPPEQWHNPDIDEQLILLAKGKGAISFITFLVLYGYLRPGYVFLFSRRFSNLRGESLYSPYESSIRRLLECCAQLGFASDYSSDIITMTLRILIQSGKSLDELTLSDLNELQQAIDKGLTRPRPHIGWLFSIQNVLYHLGILNRPAVNPKKFDGDWANACADISQPEMRKSIVAFLEYLSTIRSLSTVKNYKSQLCLFAKYLDHNYPEVRQFSQLQRDKHIESWLLWTSKRQCLYNGKTLTTSYKISSIIKIRSFFDYLAQWDSDACPSRRLLFDSDTPKPEILTPRFIPPDKERLLMAAIHELPNPLAKYGLLVLRNTGMRIGELLSLEMDCIHHVPNVGCWVKIPPGKLKTERMVPVDAETLTYFDALVKCRGIQKPLSDPKDGTLRDYLMVRHGKRISAEYLRHALFKATRMAGLTDESGTPYRIRPHQLRHTYATSLVNAGLSLPALMSLLGHVSMEMSLRYGRMFHHTIREQYDRALEQIKSKYAALALTKPVRPFHGTLLSTQTNWMLENYYKTRLVHGFCLRTPEQGACPHANVCEQCLSFHPFHEFLSAIYQQLQDIQLLIKDAHIRGWNTEENRHIELAAKLDQFLKNYDFAPSSKKKGRPKKDPEHS